MFQRQVGSADLCPRMEIMLSSPLEQASTLNDKNLDKLKHTDKESLLHFL